MVETSSRLMRRPCRAGGCRTNASISWSSNCCWECRRLSLYLGLDSSTQSLTAVVIEIDGDRRRLVFETTLDFDEELPAYGTRHGVLPDRDPAVGVSPPLMWCAALDLMMGRVASSGID